MLRSGHLFRSMQFLWGISEQVSIRETFTRVYS